MLLNKSLIVLLVAAISVCCGKAADENLPPGADFARPSTAATLPTPSTQSNLNPAISTYEFDKKKTTTTTVVMPSTTTTVIPPSPSTSSTELPTPTTSKPSPETSTTPPTTSTTTTARSSTASPTTSTTAYPNTTTLAPVTTPKPPTPTPTPDPGTGKWEYTERNQTCIIAQLAMQLNITYNTSDNKAVNYLYNVPINQTKVSSGFCGNGTEDQKISVQWGPFNHSSSFLVLFSLNTSKNEFAVKEIVFWINAAAELPNSKNETIRLYHNGNLFTTPTEMSYHCTKVQTFNLTLSEDGKDVAGTLRVSHVQLEAYHKHSGAAFSYAKDCDAIDTPDIVPIAVGCALIALVLVVLIAYLVGRRRAQARGYVSM